MGGYRKNHAQCILPLLSKQTIQKDQNSNSIHRHVAFWEGAVYGDDSNRDFLKTIAEIQQKLFLLHNDGQLRSDLIKL